MKKLSLIVAFLMFMLGAAQAQDKFDYKLVKEIVDNERPYFNDILKLYLADDKLLRTDDIALVYYGHSYMPEYKGGNDVNEKTLKNYVAENNFAKPIDFLTNYRCGKNIVDFVNQVFVPLMTKDFGGVDYSKTQLEWFPKRGDGEVKVTVFKPKEEKIIPDKDYSIFDETDALDEEKKA